jgi:acyl dehydratase
VSEDLVLGRITDETVQQMRRRIGFANPTLRHGWLEEPHNIVANADAFRRFAIYTGDDNPLFTKPEYAASSRWGAPIAPLGFEVSMGLKRPTPMTPEFERETRSALRGVQLFHSGGENFYYKPIVEGDRLYVSKYVEDVEEKTSAFGGRSVVVGNGKVFWGDDDVVCVRGTEIYVHTERRRRSAGERGAKDAAQVQTSYTDEQLAEIESAYDSEFRRGDDTWFIEDVAVGETLPRMVKGPLTITDLINVHMGAGWFSYGNPPYRLGYENRKRLRGFYTRNEFNAWDTIQRVHWDSALAQQVGVPATYDIAGMRQAMLNHYCSNIAGDDGWVYRVRYDLRNFNYMGDTTWLTGLVSGARTDDVLGPLVEIEVRGVNQRGEENLRGSATILVASRSSGIAKLPPPAEQPVHRDPDWRR